MTASALRTLGFRSREARERVRERTRAKTRSDRHSDLPLFAEHGPEPERDMAPDDGPPLGDDNVVDFPGARF